ncbi:MAG: uroporphyrinogen-III C-methyltransferase [Pseudomonadota bacterium]
MTDSFSATAHRYRRRQTLLSLALAFAIVAIGTALWVWRDVHALGARESAVAQRLDAVMRHTEALAAQDQSFAQSLDALRTRHDAIAKQLDDLHDTRRPGLLAAEAEYLVRLAAQRLALMQDPAGALALLDAAEASLKGIDDIDAHAARAALASDMALLRMAAARDIESLYLRLAALSVAVDTIAGRATDMQPAISTMPQPPTAQSASATNEPWWQRMQNSLLSLVTVRRVDAPLSPMITVGERALAAQHFGLLIEQAQLALLQHHAGIYRHSLAQADIWLARIAAGEPARRKALHHELANLQTLDIGGKQPDLTLSIAATRTLAARLLPKAGATP